MPKPGETVDIVLQAMESVLILFLLCSVGYCLAWKKWVTEDIMAFLPRLIIKVALPPFLVYMLLQHLQKDSLLELIGAAVLPLASMLLSFLLAYVVCLVFKVQQPRRGVLCVGFSTSNTVFIGIPVNIALFGPEAMPYVLIYFACNNVFFWTLGNYSIASGGEGHAVGLFSRGTLRQLLSPPLLACITGMLLVYFEVKLPLVLMETAHYIGGLPTPLGLFFIGMILYHMKVSSLHLSRDLVVVLIGRFIITPLIMLALVKLFPVPTMMQNVFIIQSSLPVMTNVAILSGLYKSDTEFGTAIVTISTLLCIVMLPLTAVLLQFI